MKSVEKWLAQHPKLYSWIALSVFPALAVAVAVIDTWPEVRDLREEVALNTKNSWRSLIDAYKEWPENVYEACEQNREYYEKKEQA